MSLNKSIGGQGVRYLAVGVSTALAELATFQLLRVLTPLGIGFSNVFAVVFATILNFTLNRNITFKSTSSPIRSFVLYLILFCLNTAFSTTFITIAASNGFSPFLAKLFTMICITLWNFFLYRIVIFK